jgi:hypothetical protein
VGELSEVGGGTMGFIFFDDSKHPEAGFCLGALVYLNEDPSEQIDDVLRQQGLVPGVDEFKSRLPKSGSKSQIAIREDLRDMLALTASIGVAVVPTAAELGAAGLALLEQMLQHPMLQGAGHVVAFDQGLFPSVPARSYAQSIGSLSSCTFHFEQDSRTVRGIQLADLAAHTCAVMLKDALGLVTKMVKLGHAEGYDEGTEFKLGWDLWAGIRYGFLHGEALDSADPAIVDSRPGLYVSPTAGERLRTAAFERFGSLYLGCIH